MEANPALDEGEEAEETVEFGTTKEETAADEKAAAEAESEETEIREEEYELDDYLSEYIEDDPGSYKLQVNNYSADEEDKTRFLFR